MSTTVTNPSVATCDLCGLSLAAGQVTLSSSRNKSETLKFCCQGCRMVYSMLMAAADAGDPARFKETELFKRCLAAGIIPATEDDLKRHTPVDAAAHQHPAAVPSAQLPPHLSVDLNISGMWCPACAWVIEESLQRSAGVFSAQCHFAVDRLKCRYDPAQTSPLQIRELIAKLGYGVSETDQPLNRKTANRELIRLVTTAFLCMNVMMLSFALYTGFFSELSEQSIGNLSWPIFLMATVVVVYGGAPIFKRALAGIAAKAAGMEALISMGALSAYLYSTYNFIAGSIQLYFDTAAMLVVLTLLGKAIEERAKKKVRKTLDGLFVLAPKKARLPTPDDPKGRYVHIDQLQTGDRFIVDEDEVLPADGIVISGQGRVEESALTGEARPVSVAPGSNVKNGTRLVGGSIIVKTTATGAKTTLGQMIAVIQASLYRKNPLENRTDHLLRYFAPAIIFLATATSAYCINAGLSLGTAVVRAVTVMVIACPCALGIAIPMARVAGIALAGRHGILVREFEAFEHAGQVDTIVFDKTGTLTTGQWRLLKVGTSHGYDQTFILRLAAGLEINSDHLIAVEIRRYLNQKGLSPLGVELPESFPDGVAGRYQGKLYRLGSRRFVQAALTSMSATQSSGPDADMALSRIFLSVDGMIVGTLQFGDRLRSTAIETVRALMGRSIKHIYLVTGDDRSTARSMAAQLGITAVHANMLPLEKARFVDTLTAAGHLTAMVGDGINDAPALARARLSVAMASANPLAHQAAQITLMGAEPAQFLQFLDLARRVNRSVLQNLWCALIYNLISIPLAMGGWISPLVAVSAMLISSLTVTMNTLRLTRTKKPIVND